MAEPNFGDKIRGRSYDPRDDENYERFLADKVYWELRRAGKISEGGLRERNKNYCKWDKIIPKDVPTFILKFDNPGR